MAVRPDLIPDSHESATAPNDDHDHGLEGERAAKPRKAPVASTTS